MESLLASLFLLLTGLCWAVINATQASARHCNCPPALYYGIGSVCTLAIALGWLLATGGFRGVAWSPLVVGCTIMGALVNSAANLSTMLNLGYGAAALYLALSSLGVMVSFLWTVLAWGEPFGIGNAVGMACFMTAIVLSSVDKKPGAGKDGAGRQPAAASGSGIGLARKRLALALCSTVSCGISQVFFIYPFSAGCHEPPLPAMVKIAIIAASYVIIYSATFVWRRHTYGTLPRPRSYIAYPVAWGLLAVLSYVFLFRALNYMGVMGRSGLTYPICSALQMLLFAVFCLVVYRDRLTPRQIVSIVMIGVGIFAVQA